MLLFVNTAEEKPKSTPLIQSKHVGKNTSIMGNYCLNFGQRKMQAYGTVVTGGKKSIMGFQHLILSLACH